jgi:DNA-binding transcriptional MerR regulator
MESMNIGQAAAACGVTAKMIRHYEEIGLVPPPRRTASNYRTYSASDVHVLSFVKLALWGNKGRSSASVKKIAGRHIAELKRKIAETQSLVAALEHLSRHCHADERPECPILDDLARELRR